jgi:type 2 lantibiotic biosynthesis protein LanM
VTLTDDELIALADRASTLRERLAATARTADDNRCPVADWRLERWRDIAAGGDEARFAARLRRLDADVPAARRALAAAPPRIHTGPPAWATTLNECLAAFAAARDGDGGGVGDPGRPLPFEDVFAPFVQVGVAKVGRACLGLDRALLERLTALAAESLHARFRVFTWEHAPRHWVEAPDAPPLAAYREFIEALRRGELRQMLRELPVLGRLLGTSVLQWIEASAELLRRIDNDAADLHWILGAGRAPAPAVRVNAGLSDPHDGGRTVALVTFASGLRAIYKPRRLALEAAWARLQAWINDQAPPCPLAVTPTIERDGYGWMAFVEHAPCGSTAAAARFFTRAGMLHYLFVLLGAADCHMGNIIAAGEYPVLIDAECVFQPGDDDAAAMEAEAFASGFIGMPAAVRTPEHPDLSGLTGCGGQPVAHTVAEWHETNTAAMTLAFVPAVTADQRNRARLDGAPAAPSRFAECLSEGFAALHRMFAGRPEALAALDPFDATLPRTLLRSTREYVAILNRSLRPRCLRDGVERSLALDELSCAYLAAERTPPWPLLDAETDALERLDIPRVPAAVTVRARAMAASRLQRLAAGAADRHATLVRALARLPANGRVAT